jgi:hypothetical protein
MRSRPGRPRAPQVNTSTSVRCERTNCVCGAQSSAFANHAGAVAAGAALAREPEAMSFNGEPISPNRSRCGPKNADKKSAFARRLIAHLVKRSQDCRSYSRYEKRTHSTPQPAIAAGMVLPSDAQHVTSVTGAMLRCRGGTRCCTGPCRKPPPVTGHCRLATRIVDRPSVQK